MLDLKRLGLVQTVTGIDTNADNLNYALECGIIDHAYPNICAESISNADLVLIATPVSVLPDVCRDIKPFLKDTACVSDVGSTKQSALNAFRTHLSDRLPQCLPPTRLPVRIKAGQNPRVAVCFKTAALSLRYTAKRFQTA